MRLVPPDRFLRLVRPFNTASQAQVGRRQIYIIPTGAGVLYGVMLLVMLAGSINYGNNLGYMLTFMLTAQGLVTTLYTWNNLRGLSLSPGSCSPVFAGEPARFEIYLQNDRRRERPGIRLALPGGDYVETDLSPESSTRVILSDETLERGLMPLGRFTLSTRYPLGLLRAWCYVELNQHCLVYPKPGAPMPVNDQTTYASSAQGDRGVGVDDFVGIRDYRAGDSPRHIHWKALAHGSGLLTKQFGGDRSEQLWLDWEMLPSVETEARLKRLCRGVIDAAAKDNEFGLRLPGKTIPLGRGEQQRQRTLEALALFGIDQ